MSPGDYRWSRATVTVGAFRGRAVSWIRRLRASAISQVSQISSASLPTATVGEIGVEGVGCHRDRITGVEPSVVAIPLDRGADRLPARGPQRQRRVALFAIGHPPDLAEALAPRQVGTELFEHAAAGVHRRES